MKVFVVYVKSDLNQQFQENVLFYQKFILPE